MTGGRRFFLAGVVSRYQHEQSWNREELGDDLRAMTALFTGELGYEQVPLMGLDPTWLQIKDALRDFSTNQDRRPDDYVVLYLASHGEILEVGPAGPEHILLPADAAPSDLRRRAVRSADLADWMLAGTKVRRLLVLIETCYSGQGGIDFARNAAAWAGTPDRVDTPDESGVVVVSATWPRQEAVPGAFASGFIRAVRDPATAGHGPNDLAVDAVVGVLNADPALPATQRARWNMMLGTGKIPGFLHNPRRDPALIDLDLAEQSRRWHWRREQEQRRSDEMRGQFVPRISGFIGRSLALTDLSRWLDDSADTRPRVVTGDPGSGKTAVLGLLAALSDPRRRPTVPRADLPAGIVLREGLVDVAIYAGNLTSSQVLMALAAAAGLDDLDPDPATIDTGLAALIAHLRGRDRPLTAIVDALDEAADPAHLAGLVLRPLLEHGQGGIKLLFGTRRHVRDHLGPSRGGEEIDLDAPRYADPQSLAALVRRILRDGASPFVAAAPELVEDATGAIAEAAGRSFFVARILATTQAARPTLPDPNDPAWRAALPRDAGPAMRQDLETRLPSQADRAIDLLRPLAYAHGPGLPWEDIWAPLANALSPGHGYTNEDLLELRERAGAYIVESGTLEDRSLYRLYHRSLTEYLRSGRDERADENDITTALIRHVPLSPNGRKDWAAAHPYVRSYLPDHAAGTILAYDLAQDPGFLLAASPPHLLTMLETVTGAARVDADAYRAARPFLRRQPAAEHAAYLALAARCGWADALADRMIADGFDLPWRPLWASWEPQRPHAVITGHAGDVTAVTTAERDGRLVVISASSDATIRIWDLATGTPAGPPLAGHTGPVTAITLAQRDGRLVVISASSDATIRIWDLATGTPAGPPLAGHTGPVNAITLADLYGTPVIVSASEDTTVRIWDLETGALMAQRLTGHTGHVTALTTAHLKDRPVIISGGNDNTIQAWDLASGAPADRSFTGHTGTVHAITTADLHGRPFIISGSEDGIRIWDLTIRMWDRATGAPISHHLGGQSGFGYMRANAVTTAHLEDRPVIISGGGDRTIRIWDLATGAAMGQALTGHTAQVNAVTTAHLEDRPVIISGGNDNTIRIWDLAADAPIARPFTGHTRRVNGIAAAVLDGRPVAISASDDTTVRAWDLATGAPAGRALIGHTDRTRCAASSMLDSRPLIVSGGDDNTIRIWDLATGDAVGEPLRGHTGYVYAITTADLDGRPVIVSGGNDSTARVWDLATGTPVGEPLTGHLGPVTAIATAHLDGRPAVVTASNDTDIRVWDLATGAPVGEPLTGHTGYVNAVTTTDLDGRSVIVSASMDTTIRIWDLATGTPVGAPLTGHTGSVKALTTADLDGHPVIVSAGSDRTIRVWDLATGAPIWEPRAGHSYPVHAMAAADLDGHAVIITGSDTTIQAWNLATGHPVGRPLTGPVRTMATADLDGHPVIVTASSDRTVRVWDLTTGALIGQPHNGSTEWSTRMIVAGLDGHPVIISFNLERTVWAWDPATGAPMGEPVKDHPGSVRTATATTLDGRPVIITASEDTIRIWDLATGHPVGEPLTGHTGYINTVTTTRLDGRPVAVSASEDRTIRVWDLATGTPVGEPLTGHSGNVLGMAITELHGRPVAISASDDTTVRAWDLATGAPIGEPLLDTIGTVRSVSDPLVFSAVARPTIAGSRQAMSAYVTVAAGDQAILLDLRPGGPETWTPVITIHVGSIVLATAWHAPKTLVIAAERGIVAIEVG
jgi:WD40 repeat protein